MCMQEWSIHIEFIYNECLFSQLIKNYELQLFDLIADFKGNQV